MTVENEPNYHRAFEVSVPSLRLSYLRWAARSDPRLHAVHVALHKKIYSTKIAGSGGDFVGEKRSAVEGGPHPRLSSQGNCWLCIATESFAMSGTQVGRFSRVATSLWLAFLIRDIAAASGTSFKVRSHCHGKTWECLQALRIKELGSPPR